jgi:hypothetical protein
LTTAKRWSTVGDIKGPLDDKTLRSQQQLTHLGAGRKAKARFADLFGGDANRAVVSALLEGACLVTVSGFIPRNDSLDGMEFDSPALRA